MFGGWCTLLAHGAAAELSPCQHSWLRPPRRVPGGPGPLLSAPINARAAPRIKNNRHHLCALGSRFESDSWGCENKQGTRSGKGLTRSLRPNPESHGGIGAREAPAAGSRLVFPGRWLLQIPRGHFAAGCLLHGASRNRPVPPGGDSWHCPHCRNSRSEGCPWRF